MGRPRKYPPELLDRGARVVIASGRPIAHVARDLGVPWETLPTRRDFGGRRIGGTDTCRAPRRGHGRRLGHRMMVLVFARERRRRAYPPISRRRPRRPAN